jgi:transcriptional/translational regulatory protein YebC/TACO1
MYSEITHLDFLKSRITEKLAKMISDAMYTGGTPLTANSRMRKATVNRNRVKRSLNSDLNQPTGNMKSVIDSNAENA